MAAGDTLHGRRLDERPKGLPEPGDYYPVVRDGARVWMACCPNGFLGDLTQHEVTEHEDGTITASPSILVSRTGTSDHWHGYLEHGVWREI